MFLAYTAVHIRQAFSKTCQVFNTSILAADFEVLKTYVQKFNDGTWNLPDAINP
jgi:hypothetical protein